MNFFSSLITYGTYLLTVSDIVEVFFFSAVCYALCLWLKHDTVHNLLYYFYGYCLVVSIAYFFNLWAILSLLYIGCPFTILGFIVVHQHTLQRNIIALKRNKLVVAAADSSWLDVIARTTLTSLTNNQPIHWIIEYTHSIDHFLEMSLPIHAPITASMMNVIVQSHLYNNNEYIVIDYTGQLRGINSRWKPITDKHDESMVERSMLYTTNLDTLVIACDPAVHTYTIIMHGTKIERQSIHQLLTIVKKHIQLPTVPLRKEHLYHDAKTYKKSFDEHHSA